MARRSHMIGWAAAMAFLTPWSPQAADRTSLSCRAQVIADCDKRCAFGEGPADIGIDPAAGTISYCRGEQCDEGRIKVNHAQGQWNDEPYLSFDGVAARGGRIWGLVALRSLAFYARGDVGDMFGTCEGG